MPHGLFLDLIIVYAIALIIMVIGGRAGVPALIALIGAGTLAGPSGAGVISTPEEVDQLAEIGIVLLLFTVGIEFPMRELRRIWRPVVAGGALQMTGTAIAAGLLMGLAGLPPRAAIFAGLFLALSSTAVVLKELARRNLLDSAAGRITTGVLLFQDLCVVLLLLAAPMLAGAADGSAIPRVLGGAASALVVIAVIGRLILPLLFRLVSASRQREAFPLAVLVASVGTAVAGAYLGVSMALGAFLAGLVLAGSEFSHQAHAEVRPLRDLLTSLFFISLGMLIDVRALMGNLPIVMALAAGTIVIKAVVAGGALALVGTPPRVVAASALYLAQVGEFSLVLGRDGLELGVLTPEMWQVLLPVSIITMLVAPALVQAAPRLAGRIPAGQHDIRDETDPPAGHVIVLGFGVGGHLVANALREIAVPYHVIDLNGGNVATARVQGHHISYGDATSPDTLVAAGLERARAVVVVLSDPDAALRIVRTVHRIAPHVTVFVRARYRTEAIRLQEAGAIAVAEELEASLEVVAQLLARLDVPGNIVQVLVENYRRREAQAAVRREAPSVSLGHLERDLLDVPVASHQLHDGDWAVSRTLAALDLRARTGASVLALRRDGRYLTAPSADMQLESGDVLYLIGDPSDVLLARERLTRGDA